MMLRSCRGSKEKVNIIMGGNATGETSLGKMLMLFANYFKDGEYKQFTEVINDSARTSSLAVDFVADENILYRFTMSILPKTEEGYTRENIDTKIIYTEIGKRDSCETCKKRLEESDCEQIAYDKINTNGWHFSYPADAGKRKTYYSIEDNKNYLYILEHILKTLDPSIKEVI
ncbi:hypothetical protein ASU35_08050 [Acetivibrio ethanolgignens]|uniref:Uncharacterized protein n=2 Tax=Acetivibrio ethanolgignens TaxID=290052 RepID=A0A0V8QHB3_9FIRM|nr:hypothetical protein [Acetivibrio ethanolgignens]KSV59818.1 hypothetical protein ASU35_08050 [Acetivibrio ethanolgignens]